MSTIVLVAFALTQWPATWILIGSAAIAAGLHYLDKKAEAEAAL